MKKTSLEEKSIFNPGEAAQHYELSRRKFFQFIQQKKGLPFVAFYNNRKLIIKDEFEKYMADHPEIRKEIGKKWSVKPGLQPGLPGQCKFVFTLEEAALYFGIGIETMRQIAEKKRKSISLLQKDRYLIIRPRMEEYLQEHPEIREE